MDNKTYLDEMYNYLTDTKNYGSAMDLAKNLEIVNQRLRDEFWVAVTDSLQLKTKEYQSLNSISLIFIKNNWFRIESNNWEFYIIDTDDEDVGINIKNDGVNLDAFEEIIRMEIEKHSVDIGNYRKLTWPCWQTFNNYPFLKKEELIKILPNVREGEIDSCANEIFSYIEKLIPTCNSINSKIREKIV